MGADQAAELMRGLLKEALILGAPVLVAEAAPEAGTPETLEERRVVLAQHRTLGRLLQLTRHNLRLLRGVYREPCGYGAPRE